MADVSHELGALRFVVESPLSSKVAMFNNAVSKHQESQHLNPFSQSGGLPKPTFNKGEYGKPLAGSLTEQRGQKANIHVLKEMLELCQIIDSEGYNVKDEPNMKVIPFGELFNIYTYISDKVVGILLRARKHKLIEFEGEVLFQRRDDDVPVFLLKPIKEIRQILEQKQDEIRRSVSPAPQATSVMMDNQRRAPSASPTPSKPKAKIVKPVAKKAVAATEQATPEIKVDQPPKEVATEPAPAEAPAEAPSQTAVVTENEPTSATAQPEQKVVPTPAATEKVVEAPSETPAAAPEAGSKQPEVLATQPASVAPPPETIVTPPTPTADSAPAVVLTPAVELTSAASEPSPTAVEEKTDINNNEEAPAIVADATTVEASSNAQPQLPPAEVVPVTVADVA